MQKPQGAAFQMAQPGAIVKQSIKKVAHADHISPPHTTTMPAGHLYQHQLSSTGGKSGAAGRYESLQSKLKNKVRERSLEINSVVSNQGPATSWVQRDLIRFCRSRGLWGTSKSSTRHRSSCHLRASLWGRPRAASNSCSQPARSSLSSL